MRDSYYIILDCTPLVLILPVSRMLLITHFQHSRLHPFICLNHKALCYKDDQYVSHNAIKFGKKY